ncbi:helix-turn-helix domain-containing protein [Geodermatophilus sp. URMC 61]|uniref:helix-turn-helix domain-containing protein n=1 Tax=Geodermatophilus sp. URMC 61 TaxID=3423411 RepID=UPI00406D0CE3
MRLARGSPAAGRSGWCAQTRPGPLGAAPGADDRGRRNGRPAMPRSGADLVRRGLVADAALTEQGRQRDGIEQQTEAALTRVLDAIGPALPTLTRQLDEWSTAIVAGGAAPPDVYERISG